LIETEQQQTVAKWSSVDSLQLMFWKPNTPNCFTKNRLQYYRYMICIQV